MVPILIFMVLALAVAAGVLYVTKTREDQARAEEHREARRRRPGPRDDGRDEGSTEPA